MKFLIPNTGPSCFTVMEYMFLSFHFSLLSQVSVVDSSVKQIIAPNINYSVAKNKGKGRCLLSTCDVMNFLVLIGACQRLLPPDLQVLMHTTYTR